MKLVEDEKLDPEKTAFLLPTANGPCRFGQYVALLRRILDDQGYENVPILSFTSADGYAGVGDQARELIRTAWRAVVVQDILLKLLLKTRPYEVNPGQTDEVYLDCLDLMSEIVARQGITNKERMADLQAGLRRVKKAFLAIPVKDEDRPLIGVVGEIFCRLNTFANNELIRHIEAQGGECWLAGVGEWVWYTNDGGLPPSSRGEAAGEQGLAQARSSPPASCTGTRRPSWRTSTTCSPITPNRT